MLTLLPCEDELEMGLLELDLLMSGLLVLPELLLLSECLPLSLPPAQVCLFRFEEIDDGGGSLKTGVDFVVLPLPVFPLFLALSFSLFDKVVWGARVVVAPLTTGPGVEEADWWVREVEVVNKGELEVGRPVPVVCVETRNAHNMMIVTSRRWLLDAVSYH